MSAWVEVKRHQVLWNWQPQWLQAAWHVCWGRSLGALHGLLTAGPSLHSLNKILSKREPVLENVQNTNPMTLWFGNFSEFGDCRSGLFISLSFSFSLKSGKRSSSWLLNPYPGSKVSFLVKLLRTDSCFVSPGGLTLALAVEGRRVDYLRGQTCRFWACFEQTAKDFRPREEPSESGLGGGGRVGCAQLTQPVKWVPCKQEDLCRNKPDRVECICHLTTREVETSRDHLTTQPGPLSEFQVKVTILKKQDPEEWHQRSPGLHTQMQHLHSHPPLWMGQNQITVRLPEGLCFWPLHDFHLLVYSKWSNQKKKRREKTER